MRALGALLLVTLLVAGCASPEAADDGTPAPVASDIDSSTPATPDPDWPWSFEAFDGKTYGPTAPGVNATVLFFMATWCSTCKSKAPELAGAHTDLGARGVRFLSIDFDPSETRSTVQAWQREYDHTWPHGLDADRSVQRELSVTIQATTIVFDGEGNEVQRFGYGRVTESGLRAAVEKALASPAAPAA